MFTFTSAELATLSSPLDDSLDTADSPDPTPIATAYNDIASWLTAAGGQDPMVIEWLTGAAHVNADDGSVFSNFIRGYTSEQSVIRFPAF